MGRKKNKCKPSTNSISQSVVIEVGGHEFEKRIYDGKEGVAYQRQKKLLYCCNWQHEYKCQKVKASIKEQVANDHAKMHFVQWFNALFAWEPSKSPR